MKPRIGISSCLLGREVRYDGGHKRDRFVMDVLAPLVTYVPVCPEMELGMGVPREPIRLERGGRLVGVESRTDHTEAMRRFAEARVKGLERLGLSGYILKKDSPSCGMERVPVHGRPSRAGRGAFAAVLMDRLPDLPVEDEGRLADPRVRERFILRVFARHRLRRFFAGRWSVDGFARFHARERTLLPSSAGAALDRLVAGAGSRPRGEVAAAYTAAFMRGLSSSTSPGNASVRRSRRSPRARGSVSRSPSRASP